MKQNSQWLSQVRTWSKSAASTSMPERLARLALHLQRQLDAAAAHLDAEGVLVCEQLVLDDVSGELAVQGDDLVAGQDAGPVRW